jgi:hypothetical protein
MSKNLYGGYYDTHDRHDTQTRCSNGSGTVRLPDGSVKTIRIVDGRRYVTIQKPTKPSHWSIGG